MGNYKINIDKPSPKKEQTSTFKNFDNLVDDYKKLHSPWYLLKGIYKDKKLIRLFLILMAVLIALLFGTYENGVNSEMIDDKLNNQETNINSITTP